MILRIDLKIFIFIILYCLTRQIEVYCIMIIFACIHEISHLIAGIFLKMKVKKVSIMPVGLSIEFDLNKKDYDKKILKSNLFEIKKIIIAISGPTVNILIAIIASLISENNEIIFTIIYSNFLIAIFNLLPIYPLDGGRILKSILSLFFSKKDVNKYINKISNIVLFFITFLFSILIYYLKNVALLFIIIYLWYIVLKENKKYRLKLRLYDMLKYL